VGSSLAFAGALFDMQIEVYMVRVSFDQKPYRKAMMEAYGATCVASPSEVTAAGRAILAEHPDSTGSLGIAISEAVERAASREDTKYALGSVLNHVLMHQTVIGLETRKQLDSGLLELHRERSSISDLVSDTVEALRPQAEQRNLILLGDVSPALPEVEIDVPRMQRVLYNLVQNALRHTPADGSILIRAFATAEEIRVSVEDTGEGIESHELARVFERCYRGDRARSREEAGSGLGLTIAKGIVELHGGTIWAFSERGEGAAFTFALPQSSS
jgi:signal transduction histidine kinase